MFLDPGTVRKILMKAERGSVGRARAGTGWTQEFYYQQYCTKGCV